MTKMFDDLMTGLDEVDAFLAGETAGYKVNLPDRVDVKGIRKRLKMTQARFSATFGFSLDAVKHWEGSHRRTGASTARGFLEFAPYRTDAEAVEKSGCKKRKHFF